MEHDPPDADSKIVVDLDSDAPATVETLWAKEIEPGKFEIRNVPVLAYGVNYGDLVEAVLESDDRYHFTRVVSRGKHSTYRIYLNDDGEQSRATWKVKGLQDEMQRVAFASERYSDRLLAIDAADANQRETLLNLLEEAREGFWIYEEGTTSQDG